MTLFGRILFPGKRRRPAETAKFFFCIPLKPKSRCASWEHTVALLGETLRSIFNQADPDFIVFIAGHDRPDLPEMRDRRVSFFPVSFPEPRNGKEGKGDQTRKMHFLGALTKEHGGGYFMVVDSDDLVHKDIVRYVREDDNRVGYMIRAGYVLDVESGMLGKFQGNTPRQFFNHCGTSSIIYLTPPDLPDLTADKADIKRGNSFMASLKGHGSWEAKLLERDMYPATLPFRGSVYRLNTGDNASYTYRRGDDTIKRLMTCVIDNPVPTSVLESDFGVEPKQAGKSRDRAGATVLVGSPEHPDVPATAGSTNASAKIRTISTTAGGVAPAGQYAGDFYSERRAKTLHSAQEILKIVMEQFSVASVIDVGCGTGTWLDVAHSLGAKKTKGLEGHWLDLEHRDAEYLVIERTDLERPIRERDQFDLAISLEVAEHLSGARAASFVEDLCGLSKRVLFGAAIPGQGGRGHVNEQWQTYWAKLFMDNGYVPLDIVRPRIWHDSAIRYWYRQNTLLYCNKDLVGDATVVSFPSLDVVHPALLNRKRKQYHQKIRQLKGASRQAGG